MRDKRELLDLMVSVIMDEALADWREPHTGQPWWDWLAGRARALRAGLLAHRDGALMLAGNRPTSRPCRASSASSRRWPERGSRRPRRCSRCWR